MEGLTTPVFEHTPKLAAGFKREAERTKHLGAWSEIFKKIKANPQDPRQDLMLLLVENILTRNGVNLEETQTVKLADEYDALRVAVGLDPADQTIDHEALVTYLLRKKGIIKPFISRRKMLKMSGAAAIVLAGAAIGNELINRPEMNAQPSHPLGIPTSSPSPIPSSETKPSPTPPSLSIAATPEKTTNPEKPRNFYQELFKPLLDEIHKNRLEKTMNDPEYLKRTDQELNQDRINIVVYSHGIALGATHGEKTNIGSFTAFSINTKTGRVDTVSWTHDLRAPEIEKILKSRGAENPEPQKVVHAYDIGGTELIGKVTENLTGLSADLVLAFPEEQVADLVNNIFGTLNIDVPKDFDVHPYYYKGQRYERDHFKKGSTIMDGQKIVEYIKAEAVFDESPEIINSNRKNKVFHAMGKQAVLNFYNDSFWGKVESYINDVSKNKKMDSSLRLSALEETFHNIRQKLTTWNLLAAKVQGQLPTPEMASFTYMVSSHFGDGGLEWARSSQSSINIKDSEAGLYTGDPDKESVQVPLNSNPNSDNLAQDYYPSTRQLVKTRLGFVSVFGIPTE